MPGAQNVLYESDIPADAPLPPSADLATSSD